MLHLDLALLPQMHGRVLSSLGLTFLMTSSLGSVPCGGVGGGVSREGQERSLFCAFHHPSPCWATPWLLCLPVLLYRK